MHKGINIKELLRAMALMKNRSWIYWVDMVLVSLVYAGYQVLIAYVNKQMVDAAVQKQFGLLMTAIIYAGIGLILILIIYPLGVYIMNLIIKKAMLDIKLRTFAHIEKLPISYHEGNHSGDIISRMTNDLNSIEFLFGRSLFNLFQALFYGIAALITIFTLNWYMAILIVVIGLISARVNVYFVKPIRSISDKIHYTMSLLTQNLQDVLAGFRTIKMFGIGDIIIGKYVKENGNLAQSSLDNNRLRSEIDGINSLLSMFSIIGVFAVGSLLAFNKVVDFGTVVAIITLQNGVSQMFLSVGNFFVEIQNSLSGAARVIDLLNQGVEPERYDVKGTSDENGMVVLRDVSFAYDKKDKALDDVSITVPEGKVVALVGPSGGGKSTLIKLLMGFYQPESGYININGRPMGEYTLNQLRDLIAYVPQNSYLFDGTIAENIRYGKPDATMEEVIHAARLANAHDFIMEQPNGYETMVGEGGAKLSGGERQRIAIARALLKNAPILLLDEATSSLDSENERLVQEALNVLMKGRTVIVVAHRLSTIKNADMIYVIKDGRVVEKGSHDELMDKKGVYFTLYNLQFNKTSNSTEG